MRIIKHACNVTKTSRRFMFEINIDKKITRGKLIFQYIENEAHILSQ